jgi:vacuolar-type H+-ATPase subunit E/Vma4
MTKNDERILKAKKELLEKQIQALYEELDEIAEEMNSEKFYATDGLEDWKEGKKEINNLFKKAEPLHEIREYLKDVLDSIEQTDLDEHFKEEELENEG